MNLFPLDVEGMFKPDKAKQRCKGFYIEVGDKTNYNETWYIEKDIAITGIKIAVSKEENYVMDNFDISVLYKGREREMFSTVYIKDIDDYKNMVCFLKVKKGSKIIITYRSESNTPKDVWFDIDYIAE